MSENVEQVDGRNPACSWCDRPASLMHPHYEDTPACEFHEDECTPPPRSKDATIAALAQEVERLAKDLETSQLRNVPYPSGLSPSESAAASRTILRRLGLALAILLLASGLNAAPKPRHVTKPISAITVKVVAQADFLRGAPAGQRGPWRITTADADSCTAWVDDSAPDVTAAEVLALRACRMRIDLAVDTAHAAAEKGGAQ